MLKRGASTLALAACLIFTPAAHSSAQAAAQDATKADPAILAIFLLLAATSSQQYIYVPPANPKLVGLHPDPTQHTSSPREDSDNETPSNKKPSAVDRNRFFGPAPLVISAKGTIKRGETSGYLNGVKYACADKRCRTAVIDHGS
ncbi:MAG: hypothetical protein ACTHLA_11780 [Asticcacaulis sp.]|uniref:hypothetical protein n=1 Tax=Asticcacaulis sp. TaxID=1872648 RepID=UPI003F7B6ED4